MHEEYREGYERPEGDWYPGKHAKKLAQTLVPGGETGYMDLYSGLGKPVAPTAVPAPADPNVKPSAQGGSYSKHAPPGFNIPSQLGSGGAGDVYQYEKGDKNVPGSEAWFQDIVKRTKRSNLPPVFGEKVTDWQQYNPHLMELAVKSGWDEKTKEWQQ
tara:strand:- start:32 stop:505 length:474 start_codon:yes stop_codon:yes gene_type:complete